MPVSRAARIFSLRSRAFGMGYTLDWMGEYTEPIRVFLIVAGLVVVGLFRKWRQEGRTGDRREPTEFPDTPRDWRSRIRTTREDGGCKLSPGARIERAKR